MSVLDAIFRAIYTDFAQQQATNAQLAAAIQSNSAKLDQILAILNEPAPIEAADLTFKDNDMSKPLHHSSKGKMKFVLNDNGTATGTITFTDSVGVPTTPAAGATVATNVTSSDPGVTVAVDATGLIVTATPVVPIPSPIPTGVIVTASVTITNPDGTVLGPFTCDDSGDPLNVTATGPAGASITFA